MEPRRTITPEDVVGFSSVTDAQVSPDGDLVAFVVGDSVVDGTRLSRSGIWVVPTAGGEPRQLTFGPRSDSTPRWSPDGLSLAFLSDCERDGQRQIYLLPRDGGEARRLTQVDGEIPSPRSLNPMAWSADGGRIGFLKVDAETDNDRKRKEQRDDAQEFERHPRFTRLYALDVEAGEIVFESPGGLQVWEFGWSPSGADFAVIASDLPYEHDWYTCRLAVLSLDGGPVRTLHYSKRQVSKPVWSPDGTKVAFLSSNWSDRGVTAGSVLVATAGGRARDVSAGHVASVSALAWEPDGERLLTVAQERGGTGLAEIDVATGDRTPLWQRDVAVTDPGSSLRMDRSGGVAVVREDDSNPADVWLARPVASRVEWTQLTRLHPQAAELQVGPTEVVHWKGKDGWEMQGRLIRPPGGANAAPHAMVTVVHGGPTGVHAPRYYGASQWFQIAAGKGIAVFLPNPRGSTGWGLEFAESNIGDMGNGDWQDIVAGIDHWVEMGVADPDRLGIAGSSYGGFMTAWAVTRTDRFAAAVMAAGISDWRSFHGRSHLCDWDSIHYGDADPWDPDGPYRAFSPITHVKRVRTPTLILHGEKDLDVPVEQSYLFHRALKDLGVETELVVYPREGHGLKERNHVLDMYRRTVAWLTEHLKP